MRWADPDRDAAALARVFFVAVHAEPSPYTPAQRRTWLPTMPDEKDFAERLRGQQVAVSDREGVALAFMSCDSQGYIDLAFVRTEYRGLGIFRALYLKLEPWARAQGMVRLWTHASLMAEAPFRAMGFLGMQYEDVRRTDQVLRRCQMEKFLT